MILAKQSIHPQLDMNQQQQQYGNFGASGGVVPDTGQMGGMTPGNPQMVQQGQRGMVKFKIYYYCFI